MSKVSSKLRMVLVAVLVLAGMVGLGLPVGAVKCPGGGEAATIAECAQQGAQSADPDEGKGRELTDVIRDGITAVIFIVGIIAVIMVVLGGIQYTTSQGDAGKVKKAKDTIMYGIIGLVVAILAFAIVNFVLGSIF